ncbi:DUF305 domain-containing protein [Blastococcus brunescens]|uniref:DUF305 domain-containing protein n=1 Tax=Blastococcus brunescens TaxID=1564165 RepID=A0ABZ1B081_9ACTN|nr:DUF305 domain-containing protein [Blastococcus sp. BMG 8361]WRL62719.1 DUF305 domain-containing protein [Blastococcus sp. BMG 8361]
MANLVPERSTDPEVEQLAFDIAETQLNQAGRMQGWLSLWGCRRAAATPWPGCPGTPVTPGTTWR